MRTAPADCIAAAQAADRKWGIFASVSLAQWAIESAWGAKATGRFNFFGIKAVAGQPHTLCWTHEEEGGRLVACQQPFCDYTSAADAFDAHARLLATGASYHDAMAHKADLPTFVRLMAAHYATDPSYAGKVLSMIQSEGWRQYDVGQAAAPNSAWANEQTRKALS